MDGRLEELKAEERARALLYIPQPVDDHRSDTAYRLVSAGGWAYYGMFRALCGILAGRPNHCYPIDDAGKRLGWELYNLPEAELDAFLDALRDCGAIDPASYAGGLLRLREVDAAAQYKAEQNAPKRLAAERTNAKRSAKRDA